MRRIGSGNGKNDFRVTGQLDDARHGGTIGDRDAPQFHVVFRGDADLGVNFKPGMTLPELRAPLRKDGLIAFGRVQGRLMRGGPKIAGRHITQIDKRSPAIARGVLAPAGDGKITPTTVSAAGAADDDMIASVR